MYLSTSRIHIKNLKTALILIICAVFFVSCGDQSSTVTTSTNKYYDLQSFFKEELKRLKSENPAVEKTVHKENRTESKTLQIDNWDNELSSFTTIDITKPAYASEYVVDSTENQISYKTTNENLDIKSIELEFDLQNNIKKISVIKEIDNTLYHTQEKLTYIKNESYHVEKTQKIIFLGTNRYFIEGKFHNK